MINKLNMPKDVLATRKTTAFAQRKNLSFNLKKIIWFVMYKFVIDNTYQKNI